MFSKPIDIIHFVITPLEGIGALEVKVAYEDMGFTPMPGDVFTSYRWFRENIRMQVTGREFDADFGILRLNCVELETSKEREKISVGTPGNEVTAKKRGRKPRIVQPRTAQPKIVQGETTKLAPTLSTDGTGRENMTVENYKESTKPHSIQDAAGPETPAGGSI